MDPKERRTLRERFLRVRNAEKAYARQLVSVARQLGIIVRGFAPSGVVTDLPMLMETLQRYENVLEPWANSVASRMVLDVNQRDKNAWHAMSIEMGQRLRNEIESAPTGHVMQQLLNAQIDEIKSLPRDAAARIYALATEAHISGRRSSEIAKEILATEDVSASRAKMIAKSAVSTASTTLVEARALYVGSPGYYWRTSLNEDVRKDHKILEGKFFRWSDPPVVDRHSGFRSHPGCNASCQCWAEVVLPAPELR